LPFTKAGIGARFAEFRAMNGWLRVALAAMLGIAGLAAPAMAANIYTSSMALPYYEMVDLAGGTIGTQNNVYAGQQVLTVNDGSSYESSALYTVTAWCVDFNHDIYIGGDSIVYTLTALTDNHLGTSPATSAPISTAEAQELAGLVLYGNQLMQADPSNQTSAAVQVAIWDIEYGSHYAGTDTALAAEVTLLQGIAPSLSSTSGVLLDSFTSNGQSYDSQSLLTAGAPGLPTAISLGLPTAENIPEPSTVTLLAAGLLGLMMVRRRARRLVGKVRVSQPS
jgi:hypothetical protein